LKREENKGSAPEIDVRIKFLHGGDSVYHQFNSGDGGHSFDYATAGAAGIDLRAAIDGEEIVIGPGERAAVPSGAAMEAACAGAAGFVFSRSGLGAKDGLTVAQGVGVIDPDYRGEIIVFLLNTSSGPLTVRRGQRIAQLIFMPFFRGRIQITDELGATDRGAGGFGHTGKM